jgi:hypothetical protein
MVVFKSPSVLQTLRGFVFSEGLTSLVGIDHRLSEKVPLGAFEAGAYCLGWVLNYTWHAWESKFWRCGWRIE